MKAHRIPYNTYITVWLSLIVLTLVTVTVAGLHLGALSLWVAIGIACAKGTFVVLYFMHLRFEDRVLVTMFFVALGTIVIILILTFSDTLFRGIP